jgi:hypothetical protein
MGEVVRELHGEPSYVLDSLAERLTRDGWKVTTRTGPLLQAARDGRFLSLTVLGSAHGTRVHAEGSHNAISYFRRAIAVESALPKEFSLKRGRPNLGAAIMGGLGVAVVAGLFLLATFCQAPSSGVKSTAITDSATPIGDIRQLFGGGPRPSVPPSATPTPRPPTPSPVRPVVARLRPRPTPSAVIPSLTPEPPAPTPTELAPQDTATPSPLASPAITRTSTPATSGISRQRATATPTPDLSRLADAR